MSASAPVKVVVVGAGFGGMAACRKLARLKNIKIQLIDRRNYHLFQPLLYQVAMAGLNPSDIAIPIRKFFSKKDNVEVTLAEVDQIDLKQKKIHFDQRWIDYDYLVLSCGAKHFYFGNNDWEPLAPGLKTIEQATEIRRRILTAFEMAEKETDPTLRNEYLTFVIVGAGPTGVELAGAIREMAQHTLKQDYKNADLSQTRVVLLEGSARVLNGFPDKLSHAAETYLHKLGVEILLNHRANALSERYVQVGDKKIYSRTVLWAAGVTPSSLNQKLESPTDPSGRVIVSADLTLPSHPHVFVIGDQAHCRGKNDSPLPGVAPVALQQGVFVAKAIARDLRGQPRGVFEYFDKGMMATIGRSKAVVSTAGFQFHGFFAWLTWVFVHIVFLMRFKNRFLVFLQWVLSYFQFGRGARLIVHKTWRFYSGEKHPVNQGN